MYVLQDNPNDLELHKTKMYIQCENSKASPSADVFSFCQCLTM